MVLSSIGQIVNTESMKWLYILDTEVRNHGIVKFYILHECVLISLGVLATLYVLTHFSQAHRHFECCMVKTDDVAGCNFTTFCNEGHCSNGSTNTTSDIEVDTAWCPPQSQYTSCDAQTTGGSQAKDTARALWQNIIVLEEEVWCYGLEYH